MTFTTNRNYIKPMLRFIIEVVMVLFGRISTFTIKKCGTKKFVISYSIANSITCFNSFWIFFSLTFFCCFAFGGLAMATHSCFTFAGLAVVLSSCFTIGGFLISIRSLHDTYFALWSKAILSRTVFEKFRQWFWQLAFATGLCYNCFRHLLFLNKSNCLGPVLGYNPFLARPILAYQGGMSTLNP